MLQHVHEDLCNKIICFMQYEKKTNKNTMQYKMTDMQLLEHFV